MLSINGDEIDKKLISEFTNTVEFNRQEINSALKTILKDYIKATDMRLVRHNNNYAYDFVKRQIRASYER